MKRLVVLSLIVGALAGSVGAPAQATHFNCTVSYDMVLGPSGPPRGCQGANFGCPWTASSCLVRLDAIVTGAGVVSARSDERAPTECTGAVTCTASGRITLRPGEFVYGWGCRLAWPTFAAQVTLTCAVEREA